MTTSKTSFRDEFNNLDTARTALVLIDYQVDVCAKGGQMVSQDDDVLARFATARRVAGALLSAARNAGAAVFHVNHLFEDGYPELNPERLTGMAQYMISKGAFVIGTPGAEIVPEVEPLDDEQLLAKTSISAFVTTDLDVRLKRRGIDTVVIAGVVTHYAVLAAALSASDLGYRTIVAADACASGSAERHDTALAILGPLVEIW